VGRGSSEDLATLTLVEARLDALRDRRPRESAFRIVGDWLIREDLLRSRLRSSILRANGGVEARVSGLPVRGSFSALRRLLVSERVELRSPADAIHFKSNLRSFYFGQQPLSLWIGLCRRPEGQLPRAMAIRQRLASQSGLRIPRVIEACAGGDPAYILEEMITGRSFGRSADWSALVDTVLPSLFQFYDQGSIRQRRAADLYEAPLIEEQVAVAIGDLGWRKALIPSPARFRDAVRRCLEFGNETLPLCIGHGDFAKGNMLVSAEGEIVVVDWECSRELPIAAELLKPLRQHRRLGSRLAAEVRKRTEDPVAMPPKRQFLLAAIDKIADLTTSVPEEARVWSQEELRARRKRKLGSWLRLASQLMREADW
jgi:hypothetical protein